MHKLIRASAILILVVLLNSSIAFAGFGLSDANKKTDAFNYTLDAGSSVDDSVVVFTIGKNPITLRLYGTDASTSNQGSISLKSENERQTGIGKWLKFDTQDLFLGANDSKTIHFKLTVPAGTPPGIYAGGVAAETIAETPTPQAGSTGVITKGRVIMQMYVDVPGDIVNDYLWSSFSYDLSDHLPVFHLVFKNRGNTIVVVDPSVEITDLSQNTPTITLKAPMGQLLSDHEMNLPIILQSPPLYGSFKAKATVTFSEFNLKTGKRINPVNLTKELTFTIIPWNYIFMGLAFILIIIALIVGRFLWLAGITKKAIKYKITSNDKLTGIADRYNVRWQLIARINKIKPPYSLKEGTTILIPSKKNKKS